MLIVIGIIYTTLSSNKPTTEKVRNFNDFDFSDYTNNAIFLRVTNYTYITSSIYQSAKDWYFCQLPSSQSNGPKSLTVAKEMKI